MTKSEPVITVMSSIFPKFGCSVRKHSTEGICLHSLDVALGRHITTRYNFYSSSGMVYSHFVTMLKCFLAVEVALYFSFPKPLWLACTVCSIHVSHLGCVAL